MSKINNKYLVLFCATFCIFSFKYILIGIGENGVRSDDVIIAVTALILYWTNKKNTWSIGHAERFYVIFLMYSLVSVVLGWISGRVDLVIGVFFVARQLEYFVFYFVGKKIARHLNEFNGVIKIYVLFLLIIVPGQQFGYIPTLSLFDSSRASGNANGPYELAAVASWLAFYIMSIGGSIYYQVALIYIMLATASRVTIAAQLCIGLIYYAAQIKSYMIINPIKTFSAASLLLVSSVFMNGGLGIIFGGESVFDRFGGATDDGFVEKFSDIYQRSAIYENAREYYDGIFSESLRISLELGGDDSGNIRIIRWAALLKSTFSEFFTIIFGMGPSFGSSAVDGYWVRVFVETGVVGLLIFSRFIIGSIVENINNPYYIGFLLVMCGTGVYIDIFVSYKPMILLWMWCGINSEVKKRNYYV